MANWAIDIGFDFNAAPDPSLRGMARQLQIGGWVGRGQTQGLCSPRGAKEGDTFHISVYDFTPEGSDNRNIEVSSVSFFDMSYQPIPSTSVIGSTFTKAALVGVGSSGPFGPNLVKYRLTDDSGRQDFPLQVSQRMFIRIQINVIDITGTIPFIAEQELIIH